MLTSTARRRCRCATIAAVALLGLVLGGCSEEVPEEAPEARPTPIANLNTKAMQIPRIEFCQRIAPSAIEDALGGEPDGEQSFGNGDEVAVLEGGGADVVQELGCEWRTDAGQVARAWVLARPVPGALAARIVTEAAAKQGCRVAPRPAFGSPSYAQSCRLPAAQRLRRAGLFGQTWLTCELTVPDRVAGQGGQPPSPRADAWCVEVANALNTTR